MATAAAIAWIVVGALTAYLAFLQLDAAGTLNGLGGYGDLANSMGTYALWNGVAAVLSIGFGAALLMRPSRGLLTGSAIWGAIAVAWDGYSILNGATHWTYIGATVGALCACILSAAARSGWVDAVPSSGVICAHCHKAIPPNPTGLCPNCGHPFAGPEEAQPAPRPSAFAPVMPPTQPDSRPPAVASQAADEASLPAASLPVEASATATPAVPRTRDGFMRRRATVVSAIAVCVVAIALIGLQVIGTSVSPAATPTPQPTATPTPQPTVTPRPTLADLLPGMITFGKPSYKVGKPIDYVATLNQDPGAAALVLEIVTNGETIGTGTVGTNVTVGRVLTATVNISGGTAGRTSSASLATAARWRRAPSRSRSDNRRPGTIAVGGRLQQTRWKRRVDRSGSGVARV